MPACVSIYLYIYTYNLYSWKECGSHYGDINLFLSCCESLIFSDLYIGILLTQKGNSVKKPTLLGLNLGSNERVCIKYWSQQGRMVSQCKAPPKFLKNSNYTLKNLKICIQAPPEILKILIYILIFLKIYIQVSSKILNFFIYVSKFLLAPSILEVKIRHWVLVLMNKNLDLYFHLNLLFPFVISRH